MMSISMMCGAVLIRSTCEWSSLTLANGNHALCDVVYGTSDKKALLFVPVHHFEVQQARTEVRKN